ncbi:hypothetical protein C0033_21750 [Clostridium sp. chh4-2]|uniref:hypothetical protein n=1 Tax=Clostridium sp. chh4-2 TaxID=2067550 RepID=UPI000CCE00EA|nr:hypothetical protein [Clostridium sp. chh4-2]PNV59905.1 hypothetical protein C0033_21750 [Clostridium sp. chh4-2]
MDAKCVRVLRPYDDSDNHKRVVYIDEDARYSLMKQWGDTVFIRGRRDIKDVEIQPLKAMDQEGFIARMGKDLLDEVYVEYGEEVMLSRE